MYIVKNIIYKLAENYHVSGSSLRLEYSRAIPSKEINNY